MTRNHRDPSTLESTTLFFEWNCPRCTCGHSQRKTDHEAICWQCGNVVTFNLATLQIIGQSLHPLPVLTLEAYYECYQDQFPDEQYKNWIKRAVEGLQWNQSSSDPDYQQQDQRMIPASGGYAYIGGYMRIYIHCVKSLDQTKEWHVVVIDADDTSTGRYFPYEQYDQAKQCFDEMQALAPFTLYDLQAFGFTYE